MKTSLICCALSILTATSAVADDKRLIAAAHTAVLSSLKDPSSARFQGDIVYPRAVCGLINAKNSYGAYVGSTVYAYVPATRQVLFLDGLGSHSERSATGSRFAELCQR